MSTSSDSAAFTLGSSCSTKNHSSQSAENNINWSYHKGYCVCDRSGHSSCSTLCLLEHSDEMNKSNEENVKDETFVLGRRRNESMQQNHRATQTEIGLLARFRTPSALVDIKINPN